MDANKRFYKWYVPGYDMHAQDLLDDIDARDTNLADALKVSSLPDSFGIAFEAFSNSFDISPIKGSIFSVNKLFGSTESGRTIHFDKTAFPKLTASLKLRKEKLLNIYLVVSHKRIGWGNCNGEEEPQRLKYNIPNYRLEIITEEDAESKSFPDALKIAELEKMEGGYILRNYIPPSKHIGAIDRLWNKKLEYDEAWQKLYEYTQQILQRTRKDSVNIDISNLHDLADKVGSILSGNRARFKYLRTKSHPFELISFFIELADVIQFQLKSLNRKDQLLEIFAKYTHSTTSYIFENQGFQDAISQLTEHTYSHFNIAESIKRVDYFLDNLMPVWRRLALASQITHNNINSPRVIGL